MKKTWKRAISWLLSTALITGSAVLPAFAADAGEEREEIGLFSWQEQPGPPLDVPGSINRALGKDTETSSVRQYSDTYTFAGSNAVDGAKDTGWCSYTVDSDTTHYIIVDLGEDILFNHIEMLWNAAKKKQTTFYYMPIEGRAYRLSYSSDGTNWTEIKAGVSKANEGEQLYEKPASSSAQSVDFNQLTARYLRLELDAKAGEVLYVWEIGVYMRPVQHELDIAKKEIEALNLPKYISRDFDVPEKTSNGAFVFWHSENPSIAFQGGHATVQPGDEPTTGQLWASININVYPNQFTGTVYFDSVVEPLSKQVIEYEIYPMPQSMTRDGTLAALTDTVTLVAGDGVDQTAVRRAEQVLAAHGFTVEQADAASSTNSNLTLDVYRIGSDVTADPAVLQKAAGSAVQESAAGKHNEENKYDAHVIDVVKNASTGHCDVSIVGRDSEAAYYALATVDQMLEQKLAENTLSAIHIEDYSNSQYRGVVEGFYGQPYSAADIESLMRFGAKYKMNTFVYGPKADPYHASKWKEPYPTEATITEEERKNGVLTQEDIREITAVADETHVDFVWAIHPMMDAETRIDIADPAAISQGVTDIVDKFKLMRELGVKDFGMFVDDLDTGAVDVLGGAPAQADLISRVAKGWKAEAGNTFRPLFYVPTLYCFESYWPIYHVATNVGPLADIDNLDDLVPTFTGSSVFSPIENGSFDAFTNCLGAGEDFKWMLWWNSPVNDGADDTLFMGPANQFYDMETDVTNARGVISNPMQQSEASKIQLFGVLDYAWNIEDFDGEKNWEDSFDAVIPDDAALREALRVFAQNSAPDKRKNRTNRDPVTYSGLDEAVKAFAQSQTADTAQALQVKLNEWKTACETLQTGLPASGNAAYRALYEDIEPWLNKALAQIEMTGGGIRLLTGADKSSQAYFELLFQYADLTQNPAYFSHTLEGAGANASAGAAVVHIGGKALNELMPLIMELAAEQMQGSLPNTSMPAAAETVLGMDTAGVALTAGAEGYALSGLSGKTLKQGEWIGASFGAFVRAMSLEDAIKALPNGIELQYSVNGRTWYRYVSAGESRPVAAVRLVNVSEAPVALTEDTLALPYLTAPATGKIETDIGQNKDNAPENAVDGDWTSFFWSNESPKAGKTFAVGYEQPFDLQSLKLVFDKGDTLAAEAAVEVSADGTSWEQVALLNGDGVGGVLEQDQYRTWSIMGIDRKVQYIRLKFLTNNASWIKLCEVVSNETTAAVVESSDGLDGEALFDGKPETLIVPNGQPGTATCQWLNTQKADKLNVYLYTDEKIPTLEARTGKNVWNPVALVMDAADPMRCTADLSKLANVTAVRLSWTAENAPRAIYDVGASAMAPPADVDKSALFSAYNDSLSPSGSYTQTELEAIAKARQAVADLMNGELTDETLVQPAIKALNDALSKEGGSSGGSSSGGSTTTNTVTTPDGTTITTVIKPDGTKIVTTIDKEGNQSVVETRPDGSMIVEETRKNGVKVESETTADGKTTANVAVPESVERATVTIRLPGKPKAGQVAVIVKPDGTKAVVKNSIATEDGVMLTLTEGATLEIEDRSKSFSDVPAGNWAADAVAFVTSRALFNGTSDAAFSPEQPMTRAMLMTVLARFDGQDTEDGANWYDKGMDWASQQGISDGTNPEGMISREQLATMLYRYAGSPAVTSSLDSFADAAQVSAYAVDALRWAAEKGIITGKTGGVIDPKGSATRAESAAMLMRYVTSIDR